MITVRVGITPSLLRWAMKRTRWDEETVRKRAPKLDAWVNGTARPTLRQMEKFATATRASFGMLFLPEPPVEDIPIPGMRTIRDAGVRESPADLLRTIYLCQRRQDWHRDDTLDSGATPLSFVKSATLSTPVGEAAARIRAALRLDEQPVPNWSAVVADLIRRTETTGILVMANGIAGSDTHRRLNPEELRGFALADDIAPLVPVSEADTKAVQTFTLVRELAHLWLGCTTLSDTTAGATQGTKEEEYWCNQVVTGVLIPLDSLRSEQPRSCAKDELDRLTSRYTVSTLVMLARLRDVGYLTRGEYRIRYETERQRVMDLMDFQENHGGGGNYYHTQLRRLGLPFTRAVVSAALEGRTIYQNAYRLLGAVKHSTFERLAKKAGLA